MVILGGYAGLAEPVAASKLIGPWDSLKEYCMDP